MRSNLLTSLGVVLFLLSVVVLGYWKIALGLLGIFLIVAGYMALEEDAPAKKPKQRAPRDGGGS